MVLFICFLPLLVMTGLFIYEDYLMEQEYIESLNAHYARSMTKALAIRPELKYKNASLSKEENDELIDYMKNWV